MDSEPRDPGFPPPRRGAEVMSPTLPLPPPRDVQTLNQFVDWVASIPRGQTDAVRAAIRDLEDRPMVARLLHEALFALPCTDLGRHLLLLSIIGELAERSSLEALDRFVWLTDEEVWGDALRRDHGPCDFAPLGTLQARAAEMLLWMAGTGGEEQVRRILHDHPSITVRIAAIDAYLFAQHDAADAMAFLRRQVRDEDQWAIGLPRRAAGFDTDGFDRRTAELEDAWDNRPPAPDQTGRA